jgi:hypothetical protein
VTRKRLSPKQREALWDAHQYPDGSGGICCHCPLPITSGQAWHGAHHGAPHALRNAPPNALAHDRCNLEHNWRVDTPQIAKTKRQRRKHLGIFRPGLGSRPLPGGRHTNITIKIGGGIKRRLTQGQRLRQTLAAKRVGSQ